jgi:hypothetical protein
MVVVLMAQDRPRDDLNIVHIRQVLQDVLHLLRPACAFKQASLRMPNRDTVVLI